MTRRRMLASALVLVFSTPVRAQNQASPAELHTALTALLTATTRVQPPPGAAGTDLVSRLKVAVEWLNRQPQKVPPPTVSREYVEALTRTAHVLSIGPTIAALEDVTRELETRVAHCQVTGVGMGGTVALSVNTRRGQNVVNDWQVFYLLKFDEWLKREPRTFLRVSSPAEMTIEPGRYWIWARNPTTGNISDRVLVEVARKKELVVDLLVP